MESNTIMKSKERFLQLVNGQPYSRCGRCFMQFTRNLYKVHVQRCPKNVSKEGLDNNQQLKGLSQDFPAFDKQRQTISLSKQNQQAVTQHHKDSHRIIYFKPNHIKMSRPSPQMKTTAIRFKKKSLMQLYRRDPSSPKQQIRKLQEQFNRRGLVREVRTMIREKVQWKWALQGVLQE